MRVPIHAGQALVSFSIAALAIAGVGGPSHGAVHDGGEALTLDRLFPDARFDPSVPTQEAVTGVRPGSRPLRHAEVIRYFEALAASSPRAALTTYSKSHEGRRLVILAVSDETTITGLDAFREEHARRVDPRGRPAGADASAVDGAKAVAWMAYGIHGDELSSVDAAAAVAYRLVAGEDDRARALRAGLVTLIDPIENPDGRERFLAQTTAFAHAVPNPDLEDLSHTTVWPWGRGNHYLFDLNRDWFSMVHPESRRSAVIATWNPQLMVDSHEMWANDSYLFSPPRHPFNPHLPATQRKWWDLYAADQARALDARGYGYYTREWNEEFFPGYGSSWASYFGAVGILYEMSSTEGTLVKQRAGTVRTYAQAVEHHVASSVANLETLAANRTAALRDYLADRREVIERARKGPVAAWVLAEGRHPERTRALVRLLRDQGVEVMRAETKPARIGGLRDGLSGRPVEPGALGGQAWLVPADQPAGGLVRVLLDPHVPMEPAFLREEREHLETGRGTRLYETTAWSLPLSYGIEHAWTSERPAAGWDSGPVPDERGVLEESPRPFGYLIDGTADGAAVALAALHGRGISVRLAEKPFTVGGRSYPPGSLLVKREGNPDDLAGRLREIAAAAEVRIAATPTAKAEKGPDLGGGTFHPLLAPRVGIWTGAPVSPSSYGALWHLLDREIRMRFNGLDISGFGQVDLGRYNVLVFPPVFGDAQVYRAILDESGMKRLKAWIEAGGTAIGIGSGAEFLASEKSGLTKTRLRREALGRYPPVVLGPGAEAAEAGGPLSAPGLRADKPTEGKAESDVRGAPRSPYDVAPILGAGARPFAAGSGEGRAAAMTPVDLADWLAPLLPPGKKEPDREDLERADERLRRFTPRGVFLRIETDPNVWMTWGLPRDLPAFVRSADTLVAEPPVQVPARFTGLERLHLGGLLWPEGAARTAHTAYATREKLGRGQVILFLNEPEFRGWTLATRRLLLNAVLAGPGMGTDWSSPW